MPTRYVSNARTRAELHAEFLSDLQRRLDDLDKYLRTQVRSVTESARIARARNELLDLQDYWKHIELAHETEPTTAQPGTRLGLGAA
jgi:hypothetical protein